MGDRTDLPKIKPDSTPSIFNGSAANYGLIGAEVGAIAGLISPRPLRTSSIASLIGAGAGLLIGGITGKGRATKEHNEGKVVKDPTIWNSGMATGALVSEVVFAGAGLLGVALPIGNFISFAALGIIGGFVHKRTMQHEFDQAIALRDNEAIKNQQLLRGLAQQLSVPQQAITPLPNYKNSVSADEAALLDAKQNASVSHAEKAQAPTATHEAHAVASAAAEPVAQRA